MLETTLHQLQRTQPDAEIKWFDGSRFFNSRDEALAAGLGKDEVRRERKSDWRPGGDHKYQHHYRVENTLYPSEQGKSG